MSEKVVVWSVHFPWNKRPLEVSAVESIRTAKQIRRPTGRTSSGTGWNHTSAYEILDPRNAHYTEQDAVADCERRTAYRLLQAKTELAEMQAQADEVAAYRAKREQEGWS